MLNSYTTKKTGFALMLILSALLSLSSCMPTSTAPAINQSNIESPANTPSNTNYSEPPYPLSGLFVQEGANRTSSTFTLPVDFNDSFLVRGKSLSAFLRTVPNTTKFCIVGKYTYDLGKDRFLIMAAKPRSYTDLIAKTTEFYLQIEPSNDVANQNDCLTFNLTNELFKGALAPTAHFSLSQLCTNCATSVTSSGLKLYFFNGERVPEIVTEPLLLKISGSSTGTSGTCSENTICKNRGFDCCLDSTCVKEGAVKPGVINLPGFLAAQEDVALNSNRYVVYPQFYFVCGSSPGNTTGGSNGSTPVDPEYEAAIRIMELQQLYNCLNKVDGEFSHCTLKFIQADKSVPGIFSGTPNGFTDDINFSTLNPAFRTGEKQNNIVKVIYAGQVLYDQLNNVSLKGGTFVPVPANNIPGSKGENDDLITSQGLNLIATLPTNAKDTNLYITYKVDGTCERVSSTISKCTKTYIHGSSNTNLTTWHDFSKTYLLPLYADVSANANIIVKIGGLVVPKDVSTWDVVQNGIAFDGAYPIFQNQTIEITYFAKSGESPLKLRNEAQNKVNSMCSCATGTKCNLKPILDTTGKVTNFECSYPSETSTEPPVNQTIFVSAKNTPHRYFDRNGVNYDDDYGSALEQLPPNFNYTNNDILKPNNLTQYIGFNEIYGPYNKSGTYIAKPAKTVRVKKDKLYDLLVNSGSFSSCPTCGTDYYSSLQRIFPSNFAGRGGGYKPDNYASKRENSSSLYRSDDLLFGRACFVPATMIPWTHVGNSFVRDQRNLRLQAQHFLFANGYNRDWYGFDYGSLIGSFDGVTWFSIGNQRRIKATTNKLYLAVNAYVGDLNIDNNFNVTVMETTAFSSDIADHDTETDGAECQKSHYCSNDNDCFRQLGYDYSCQNVASLTTNWPQFDSNAAEVSGSINRSILSLIGGSNGQARRCMYRGRGTPCQQDLRPDSLSTAITFNNSILPGTLACSSNNSCLPLTTLGKFNNKIARFANTPTAQNSMSITPLTDTVGLGARIITRPYEFYGTNNTPDSARSSLLQNNVRAICVPGKDILNAVNNLDLNQKHPVERENTSDKIFGVGPTAPGTQSIRTMNACPATDAVGISMTTKDLELGSAELNKFTIAQNLNSNLLNLDPFRKQKIYNSNSGVPITTIGYQQNACLRSAGSSCFSDMECAPSGFIGTRAKAAASELKILGFSDAEINFWQEDLTCGNPDFRVVNNNLLNPTFDVKKNRCCRDLGKTMTVYTEMNSGSNYQWCTAVSSTNPTGVSVAGVFTNLNSTTRYSRVNAVFDRITCNTSDPELGTTKSFALSLKAGSTSQALQQILTQYKTLDTLNQRTCCTTHWVRSFATENGGGHAFAKTKLQNIDKTMFKNVSWAPDDSTTLGSDPDSVPFECDKNNYLNGSCEIKNLTPAEETKYLTWAGTLELIGIPQVAVPTTDQINKLVNDAQGATGLNEPLTDSNGKAIMLPSSPGTADFSDATNLYYSASSYDKMNMTIAGTKNSLKKVFSENEFNCCIPSGQEVLQTTNAGQCCTGYLANIGGPPRCCLPDFTDVTLYLNRYVSSEGRGLPDSAYDSMTGYIKDPGQVKILASQKSLCCSGNLMTGVAISNMSIPIEPGRYIPGQNVRRFNYRTDIVDNNSDNDSVGLIFDAGVRWNNHVYCVPAGFGSN